jgi:hypothetical protein
MTSNAKKLWGVGLGILWLVGCSVATDGPSDPEGVSQTSRRELNLGNAQLPGSCKSSHGDKYCGGKAKKGACWCDVACLQYGDCCADADAVCNLSPIGAECSAGACGPALGMPVKLCSDGVHTSGPTGKCLKQADATCAWEISSCPPDGEFCGGIANFQCPAGKICVDNPNDSCDPQNGGADCGGICVDAPPPSNQTCGGFANLPCPDGKVCVDDPNDSCDPQNGGADCGGICVDAPPPKEQLCGGFANLPCPDGKVCVDNPNDSCDPQNGGADCGGICVDAPPPPAANSCVDHCGGIAADKSCYCDSLCTKYGDCCKDYAAACAPRVPVNGGCAKSSGDTCSTDADCTAGGCGGELCYNPAMGGGISTCECTTPTNVTGCGCVAGKCSWYK